MKKAALLLMLLIPLGLAAQTHQQKAEELLSKLDIYQKASLMQATSVAIDTFGIADYNWWNEALHGVGRNGSATMFPEPIGMASSFDDELLLKCFEIASDEARVKFRMAKEAGTHKRYQFLTFWTPNVNIFRDPRWGRGMETYGEDPYLTARMGLMVVKGLQGEDKDGYQKTQACAKHYAVHSGPEPDRHRFDVDVSQRDLFETYLPAFKALVTEGGVREVMTAYNRFRGVPCGANPYLIDTLLRGKWGYEGIIVSDCGAVADFWEPGHHEWVADQASAAAAGVKAGLDLECGNVYSFIPEAIERGLLTEEEVDKCLLRLLTVRYALGELEGVDPWSNLSDDIVESEEHKAVALDMAHESLVLLLNKNRILPLQEGQKIALVGPNADDVELMWGNYNGVPKHTITLREALPDAFYLHGCDLVEPSDSIDTVVNQLADYEVVVFAGGISPRVEGEEKSKVELPGFYKGDRTSIELPAVQRQLIETLHKAGKKVILVNFSGSAVALAPEAESCEAILQAWYPGQMGGTAIADVLYGRFNPCGKLPVTFYKSDADLPDFNDYNMASGHTYRFFKGEALFPFGYGLNYSDFQILKAVRKKHKMVVKLVNKGDVTGTEVLQLYVSKPDDTAGPIKTLRDFKRVTLGPGKKAKVKFNLDDKTFLWWNEAEGDMGKVDGDFVVKVGNSSSI